MGHQGSPSIPVFYWRTLSPVPNIYIGQNFSLAPKNRDLVLAGGVGYDCPIPLWGTFPVLGDLRSVRSNFRPRAVRCLASTLPNRSAAYDAINLKILYMPSTEGGKD